MGPDSSRLAGASPPAPASGVSASAGWQRSDGVDSFSGAAARWFHHRAASVRRSTARPGLFGVVGHWVAGGEFDGFVRHLPSRRHARQTRTGSRHAVGNGRMGGWSIRGGRAISTAPTATARRRAAQCDIRRSALWRPGVAADRRSPAHRRRRPQKEDFRARDTASSAAPTRTAALTDRRRRRWRARWASDRTDIAVRHDASAPSPMRRPCAPRC